MAALTLVTGSAGHLGEALVRTLRANGEDVRGLDIKPSPFTDHVGSVSDPTFVAKCIAGVRAVIHTATLHKPHVATHSAGDFVDTNVKGTLTLLEAAVSNSIESFVFTSSTSAFGAALNPALSEPAAWIVEDVPPVPKNIYGTTKVMAESLCELMHRKHGLPVLVLRTSRFFPEADDDPRQRETYSTENLQANELLYRRVDLEDVVSAHRLAVERAPRLGFRRYIISATTPFARDELPQLRRSAPQVVRRHFPDYEALYASRGWRLFPGLDRVYVNTLARTELGWQPRHDFRFVLDRLSAGVEFRSALALQVGSKGYHEEVFADGPYPVAAD